MRGPGRALGIMVLGVYITYKLLDYSGPDRGRQLALGGCMRHLILNKSMNPVAVFLESSGGPGDADPGRYGSRIYYNASTPCLRFLPSLQES